MCPDIVGRLRPPRLASAPVSPAFGEMYYDSSTNILYYWNGVRWVTSGTTGAGTPVLAAVPVSDVGVAAQIRAGRQLTAADFTALGLSAPTGLWNLSDLTDASGNARALVNKGAVPFGPGINGLASTAAVFSGSTAQALYIADTGAGDPFRIKTGSWGCWFRTAKRGVAQYPLARWGLTAATAAWALFIAAGNTAGASVCDGVSTPGPAGVSDVADDRWHFAVVTHDGTSVRLFVDGVLEGVAPAAFTMNITGAIPVNIGAYGADGATAGTGPHYGRVDEAFVTSDVLSDDQIRALYCAKLAHGFTVTPTAFTVSVRRARKGAALVVTDFPTQPLRLHNFTAGSLGDQGSGAVALTNNGAALSVAGADGALGGAFNFVTASSQSLSSTDAGLPAGTAARSYGCWFKSTNAGGMNALAWGTFNTGDARLLFTGTIQAASGGDTITGPYCTDGLWHCAVIVEDNAAGDGVKRKLYLDGRLAGGSTVLNAIVLAGAGAFRVGAASNGTGFFTGQLDGAFVCGYALTQDQISTLYAKGSQALAASPKNAGDHVEYADATNIYATFDVLDSQHQIDLAVTG